MALFNTNVPELSGSDTAVCLDNLELLGLRQSRITESMLAAMSELADAVIRDAGGDPDTVDSILLSLQGGDEDMASVADAVASVTSPINRDLVTRLSVHTEVQMRLILYRLVYERLVYERPVHERPVHERMNETDPDGIRPSVTTDTARGRIAYMAGAFADKAYDHLSRLVPNARAATFHSFVDACEEVRGGLCEYGILPLENTQSGKLTAFSRLILRYGLFVVAVCDLENGAAPGQFTRFALLQKAPEEIGFSEGVFLPDNTAPPLLEILHTTALPSLTDLLSAAVFCGLSPVRVDTLPRFEELDFLWEDTPSGAVQPMCCVFSVGDEAHCDLPTFIRFLELEASEDTVMGIYRVLPATDR